LLTVAAGLVGCAGLSQRVDRAFLDEVPNEELLLLFDAENGVYIAKDERADAQQRFLEAEEALDRAKRYAVVIEERKKSGDAIDTPAVLSLLEEWNAARIQLRKAEIEFTRQKKRTATARLWASRARYEQAKAKLVKEHNPEQGASIDLAKFDEQVTEKEAREQDEIVKLAESEQMVSEQRAAYNGLSDRLQQASGGAYGGPWADLLE
jgi:chromosome segregation ATPase